MPTYNFRDINTNEVIEKFMSISAREEFLKENPQYETIITGAPMLMDPMRAGTLKRDSGFKHVLQQIHERTPGSDLKKMNAF
jgi:hypothetical protein